MKRAVIYLRVSTAAQADKDTHDPEGYSIPAQREACSRKAESLDAEVVGEFIDRGESARSADRPQLQAMLSMLEETKDIDFCVVHKVDRLARNRQDDILITIAIQKAGTRLVSVTENIDDTPSGKLTHGIMSTIAEFYSSNLATEVKKGMSQKAKSGGTPGRVPIGYRNVPVVVDNHVVHSVDLDKDRAPFMRRAFELYATGEYSIVQVCDILNEQGFKTVGMKNHPPAPLAWGTLGKLFAKPYYAGFVTYNGQIYEGRHEAIISRELFDSVQNVLKARLVGEKQRVHLHYLKSSLYCGRCFAPLRITAAKATFLYYYCSARPKKKQCNLPYINVKNIESAVSDYFKTIQLTEYEVESVRLAVIEYMRKSDRIATDEVKHQRKRLDALLVERAKLMQAYYASAISLEILGGEQKRLDGDIRDAEALLAKYKVKFEDLRGIFEQTLWLARNCYDSYLQAPGTVRRQIHQAMLSNIFVDEDPETTTVEVLASALAEPFGSIVALAGRSTLQKSGLRLGETKNAHDGRALVPGTFYVDQGSDDNTLVHLAGSLRKGVPAKALRKLLHEVENMEPRRTNKTVTLKQSEHKILLSPARRRLNIDVLIAQYEAGRSLRELATEHGVDRKTVALQLRKAGVVLRLPGCNVVTRCIALWSESTDIT
jgi:DNA invertase Pin-like site-specific DNA recombinase